MEIKELLQRALLEPLVVECSDSQDLRRALYIMRREEPALEELTFRILSPSELLVGTKEDFKNGKAAKQPAGEGLDQDLRGGS